MPAVHPRWASSVKRHDTSEPQNKPLRRRASSSTRHNATASRSRRQLQKANGRGRSIGKPRGHHTQAKNTTVHLTKIRIESDTHLPGRSKLKRHETQLLSKKIGKKKNKGGFLTHKTNFHEPQEVIRVGRTDASGSGAADLWP